MNTMTAAEIADLLAQHKAGVAEPYEWADKAAQAMRRALWSGESWVEGRDAAFPANLHNWDGLAIGYYGGPLAFHVWGVADWRAFGGYKLPIWVGGYSGAAEGQQAVNALHTLEVPAGCETVLDMETRVDRTYVDAFGDVLSKAGYRVLVYGSVSTLFKNPQLNGYAVADPTGVPHMYPHPGVRMTQYAFGPVSDKDVIRQWIAKDGFLWR